MYELRQRNDYIIDISFIAKENDVLQKKFKATKLIKRLLDTTFI